MNLYVTADRVGQANHGAGSVTFNESEALKSVGEVMIYGRDDGNFTAEFGDVWGPDEWMDRHAAWCRFPIFPPEKRIAHFYAGSFSKTIANLKHKGYRVTYTAAAHSIEESRKAHEELGIPYNYPHLTDPELWKRYLQGYKDADVLIVPSTHSAETMRSFGCENRIVVIPHGVNLPVCSCVKLVEEQIERESHDDPENNPRTPLPYCSLCDNSGAAPIKPLPKQFTVGYLGNCGAPDKGLRYLFAAWKKLNWTDAVLKIAGHDSTSMWVRHLWATFGGCGNVQFCGWQEDAGAFYDSLSLYVQPSVTEGFGLEVLEAMAHGRPVLCSKGAGSADVVDELDRFEPRDVDELADKIDRRRKADNLEAIGRINRTYAALYTWDKIRVRYVEVWKELLG